MAKAKTKTGVDGPSPFSDDAYDFAQIPGYDNDFVNEDDFEEFAKALAAPDNTGEEITALNDWRPIHQRVRRRGLRKAKGRKPSRRGVDETREGFVYTILQWPLLIIAFGWILILGVSYMFTRLYIYLYEHFVTNRGRRERLRKTLQRTTTYGEWVHAAKELDGYLGNDKWKITDEYAYYDSKTIRRVRDEMRRLRKALDQGEKSQGIDGGDLRTADELRNLAEAAIKGNFAGTENPRLYSESYYGTKALVQSFIDEVELSLTALFKSAQLSLDEKAAISDHLSTNYGRTAFCLSGGATFAYYHFGVAKALLDAGVLPTVITGTSGGALVAALLGTRTDEELKKLLVPALAGRITACQDRFFVWAKRWWRTGARFDSIEWAKRCAWFTHGSLTFREAYERTGRILNVTCVPSDPHSPTILANYLTSADCVVWSAVLASAAVPGILNPVVLMRKTRDGTLAPYSFGHKWKDGSLRTDIPLKALNTHFNVSFSIVSQVNPHINLFFFSSRGTVGRPVTHRRGRGWRGGFLGSATEQYLKLDLNKWLKVLRHLELLPRPLGQDWSEIWLQRFSGTITIWPKSRFSDFPNILSDPSPLRLAYMIHAGQQSTFPKLKFIENRLKVERIIEKHRQQTPSVLLGRNQKVVNGRSSERRFYSPSLSEEDLQSLLDEKRGKGGAKGHSSAAAENLSNPPPPYSANAQASTAQSPTLSKRLSGWWSTGASKTGSPRATSPGQESATSSSGAHRRGSVLSEIGRQSRVFFDDSNTEWDSDFEGSVKDDESSTEDKEFKEAT